MRGKKIIMALSLAICAALLTGMFAACGGGRNKGNDTLWIGFAEQGYGGAWLEKGIADFKVAYPQYNVVINERSAEFSSLAETRLQTDKTVNDLIIAAAMRWQPFAVEGKLADLSDVYAQPMGNDNEDTIESGMLEGIKRLSRGKGPDGSHSYYILKIEDGISSFIYNKTVVNFYESRPEWSGARRLSAVTTVDELTAWAAKLTAVSTAVPFEYKDGSGSGPVAPFVYPGQYLNYWDSIVSTWWAQYSGFEKYCKFFEMEDATVYSDEGRLKALQAFEKLNLSQNALLGSSGFDHINSQNAFVAGKAALIPNGMWIETESKTPISNWGVEIGMMPVPFVDAQHKNYDYVFCASGSQALIPLRPDTNVELAKKFLAFLNTEQQLKSYTRLTGGVRPFYHEYTDELVENLEVSDFVASAIRLRKNADYLLNDVPQNILAPNYLLVTNGDSGKWCLGLPYGAIISGESSASKIYSDEVKRAGQKWNEWLEINKLS